MSNAYDRVLVVGVSGPSSSGKSTLGRLLREILPHAFILHQDDYYKSDDKIPQRDGLDDWDCPESVDFDDFRESLRYVHEHRQPPGRESKEDQNELGEPGVSQATLREMKQRINGHADKILVCLVDGFLLYHDPNTAAFLDTRLLLRAGYADLKRRREARSGYVTLDGFWNDPPGYFDRIVWPAYVQYHGYLFQDGDVHGPLSHEALAMEIQLPPRLDATMRELLSWAVDLILAQCISAVSASA